MERCLWSIGFLALAAWFGVWFNARQQQAEGNRELERRLETPRGMEASRSASSSPGFSSSANSSTRATLAQDTLVGRIEIPRLHVSTIVFEGTGDNVLSIGVGHLSGSALPGEHGNIVLAAHRDTFFRPLRSIHKYDRIVMITPAGTRRYSVDSTEIVSPNYTAVLAPTPDAALTLITCYPFEWFGHAPRRFIVRAHEMDDPTSAEAPAPAMNARVRAEEPGAMDSVDRLPPVHLPPVHATRTAVHARPEPVACHAGPTPFTAGIAPAPLDEPAPSVKKTIAVQDTTEMAAAADAPAAPMVSRMMRGLKKLNPKGLLARIAGQ